MAKMPDCLEIISDEELRSTHWWQSRSISIALFYGLDYWKAEMLQAARSAGVICIIETDSDGRLPPLRVSTGQWLDYIRQQATPRQKSGMLYGALKNTFSKNKAQRIKTDQLIEATDYLKIESEGAADGLRRSLRERGLAHCEPKVLTIPFAVRNVFMGSPVPETRDPVVVLAGRIDAYQKGPELLLKTIRRFLNTVPEARLRIHSRDDSGRFAREIKKALGGSGLISGSIRHGRSSRNHSGRLASSFRPRALRALPSRHRKPYAAGRVLSRHLSPVSNH